jgi:hypothetical protein
MMPMTLPPASNLAINRTGDLWELDRHRVYCGNTPDPRVYARLMDGERATTVVTGPPYNVRIDGHVSGLGAVHHRDLVMASGEMDDNEFTDVDQLPPMAAPFITFLANGCMADYEATPDLIGKLKHGEMLTIQAVNVAGAAISFALPLVDFAKANVGPPTYPKVLEEQQPQQQERKLHDELQRRADEALKKVERQRLQGELQKRADEARKKLESQGGAAPASSR